MKEDIKMEKINRTVGYLLNFSCKSEDSKNSMPNALCKL